jgi:Outer membrane protein beta-barrel domain
MEHVDNNMDDLFRKAGNSYPLKTAESDWDGVFGKLKESAPHDNTYPGSSENSSFIKRRWALLLLLIPIGLGAFFYFSPTAKTPSAGHVSNIAGNNSVIKGEKTNRTPATSARKSVNDLNKPENANKQSVNKSKISVSNLFVVDHTLAGLNDHVNLNKNHPSQVNANDIRRFSRAATFVNASNSSFDELMSEAKTKSLTLTPLKAQHKIISIDPTLNSASSISEPAPGLQSKMKSLSLKSDRGFYVGVLIGPDLSTVHFQSVKQAGLSLGILVGYRMNTHISLESGLLWDKKYYYSTGEYFKKDQTGIPPNVSIINLDGSCGMFEIPLALRYDFPTGNKHGFFAKAGLSTYLMKKENYSYEAEYSGGGTSWPETATYYNSSRNIFSIVTISAGYEHLIGISGKTKIRVEPYFKIPMQGIGVGSMPISSAGLYLGIIHSFR